MGDQLLIMDAEFYGFVFNFRLYKHLEVHMIMKNYIGSNGIMMGKPTRRKPLMFGSARKNISI
jgi:hypothetical protein